MDTKTKNTERHWMRLVRFFYERIPDGCVTQNHHGHAYFDYRKMERVMVIYPLHYAVNFAYWLNCKWCNHRLKPSWIDRELKDHEIAQLVNLIKAEIEPICSNQSLRFRISKVVTNYFHSNADSTNPEGNGE